MTVVNMLLGGYFGSRLMKNIREEKGLTYGIYSSIEPLFYGSAFSISVELNNELIGVGVEEIFKELEKLRSTLVSENELEVVRNYYLGSFLRGFDGVFSLASYCKTLIDYNLDYTYYYDYLNVINNITPERIMDLSKKYLNPTDMSVVIAGKKNV
jgi:predicted Zn-dependent peptidase